MKTFFVVVKDRTLIILRWLVTSFSQDLAMVYAQVLCVNVEQRRVQVKSNEASSPISHQSAFTSHLLLVLITIFSLDWTDWWLVIIWLKCFLLIVSGHKLMFTKSPSPVHLGVIPLLPSICLMNCVQQFQFLASLTLFQLMRDSSPLFTFWCKKKQSPGSWWVSPWRGPRRGSSSYITEMTKWQGPGSVTSMIRLPSQL